MLRRIEVLQRAPDPVPCDMDYFLEMGPIARSVSLLECDAYAPRQDFNVVADNQHQCHDCSECCAIDQIWNGVHNTPPLQRITRQVFRASLRALIGASHFIYFFIDEFL